MHAQGGGGGGVAYKMDGGARRSCHIFSAQCPKRNRKGLRRVDL